MGGREKSERLLLSLLLLLMFCISSIFGDNNNNNDNGVVMSDLAKSLTNLPADWTGDKYCDWTGVSCRGGDVTALNLASRSISGRLPDSFTNLASLQALRIQGNQISGPLPSFSGMASLQSIAIDGNAFTGPVPTDLFSGLPSLQDVSMEDLAGLSPWSLSQSDLASCDSLRSFSAANSSLTGPIPDFFARLDTLRLSYNHLSGPIPASFASPSSTLRSLSLNNQQSPSKLTGSLNPVAGMTQLSLLWLQSNSFSGPIPDLSNLTSLASFNVRDNQLTGPIPASLLSCPTLNNVTLNNNALQGPYPSFSAPGVLVQVDNNNFCNDKPHQPCDPRVTLLLSLAAGFGYPQSLASDWKGDDPCSSDSWNGVLCDSQGNIVTLNFPSRHLVGVISPDIANITSLTKIVLSNNNLTGPIPDSLTSLKSLQLLDLTNNNIYGRVPHFADSVTLKTAGNLYIGRDPPPGTTLPPGAAPGGTGSSTSTGGGSSGDQPSSSSASKSALSSGIIAVIVIAVLLALGCLAALIYCLCYRKKPSPKPVIKLAPLKQLPDDNQLKVGILMSNGTNGAHQNELFSHSSGDRVMSTIPIEELRRATDDFSDERIIGEGGFGVVYRGELNGNVVAIKRSNAEMVTKKAGLAEFEAEVHVLQKTRHRHLVTFLGYCRDNNEKLLVYEYMPEGTLGQHLFQRDSGKYCALNWRQRLVIALDVARGVEYLHSLAQESFIHRDLKPSNILLGNDLRAKVSDFGLVKLADKEKSVMTRLAGTFGYLAPEYALTGKVSTKVDVYAFGVILMELITGRKVIDESLGDEDCHLVTAFRRYFINKEKFMNIVDLSLDLDRKAYECVFQVSELACHCTAREPHQRPTMGYAVQVLSPLVDQWVPSTSSHHDEYSNASLTQELVKWQSDTDSSMFSTHHY